MPARRVARSARRAPRALLTALLTAWAASGARATAPEAGGATEAALAFERGLQIFEEARAIEAKAPAERAEAAERYRRSAESFAAAWKAGAATTEVFTNAANAYHFGGARGESVLFYRRALAVDPSNLRAKEALEHIRSTLPLKKPEGGAGSSILRTLFFWHEGFSFRARKTAFLVLFPLAFAAFGVALYRRRPFLFVGICLLVPALALLGSLIAEAAGGSIRDDAVLLVEVEGRLGDGSTYSPSHSRPFPPGTEVSIQSSPRRRGQAGGSSEWAFVRLLDGSESWVPAAALEKVLP